MVELEDKLISGSKMIERQVFLDARGHFTQVSLSREQRASTGFFPVQTNVSVSKRGVLRGLHLQAKPHGQSKLVTVISGSVLDFFVNLERGSESFGQLGFALLTDKGRSLLLDRALAHGFLSLEDNTVVCYQVDGKYRPDAEIAIDPFSVDSELSDLFRELGENDVIRSEKDRSAISFSDYVLNLGIE